jgi:GNAT superfamily N-acetyltransferase
VWHARTLAVLRATAPPPLLYARAVPASPDTTRLTVRPAAPGDVLAICAIATAAWRATYAGLIGAEAIEWFLATAYAPERVGVRVGRHEVLVAAVGEGREPAAFAETVDHGDHLQLAAIYVLPELRGRGLGSALLDAIVERHPATPVAADVLVGNTFAEPFYEARGFEPGELLVEEIAGEPIRERRWWLRPPGLFDPSGPA